MITPGVGDRLGEGSGVGIAVAVATKIGVTVSEIPSDGIDSAAAGLGAPSPTTKVGAAIESRRGLTNSGPIANAKRLRLPTRAITEDVDGSAVVVKTSQGSELT